MSGDSLAADSPTMRVYDAWLADASRKQNASTINSYKLAVERLAQVHADTPIKDITEEDIEDHIDWLINDHSWSKSTVATRYQCVKAFFSWAYETKRIIDQNPTGRVSIYDREGYSSTYTRKAEELRAKAGIVYASPQEVEQIARHVRPPRIRNELMVRLAFQTGARATELCNIKVRDIGPDDAIGEDSDPRDERKITLQTAKRDEPVHRNVWYSESLDMLMQQWLADRESRLLDDCPYLFVTNRSGNGGSTRVSEKSFRTTVVEAAKDAGIQEVMYTTEVELDRDGESRVEEHDHYRLTPHALRHGFGVACVRAGMDIRSLQILMGISKLETAAKYLKLDNKALRDKAYRYAPE